MCKNVSKSFLSWPKKKVDNIVILGSISRKYVSFVVCLYTHIRYPSSSRALCISFLVFHCDCLCLPEFIRTRILYYFSSLFSYSPPSFSSSPATCLKSSEFLKPFFWRIMYLLVVQGRYIIHMFTVMMAYFKPLTVILIKNCSHKRIVHPLKHTFSYL